jgi:TonB-linked SusC/RagA family outer membrane protein
MVVEVLDKVFAGENIGYTIDDKHIILYKSDDSNLVPQVSQQTGRIITGTVTDAEGEPLPGVNVVVKGTSIGMITDVNGRYSINVPDENAELQFSFMGFATREFVVGTQRTINVEMQEDISELDEVIVIGYGTQRRRDVTGSVASVTEREFADRPMTSVTDALAGHIAGLDIVAQQSTPGSLSSIRLRGQRSFQASNEPMIILDGMVFEGSLNDINPYDVTSIDVLKDASSTAIYGSRGANGVIIITTRRGKVGRAQFSLDSQIGIQTIYGKLPVMNSEQWAERFFEGLRTAGINEDQLANEFRATIGEREWAYYLAGGSTDWQEYMLQTGFQQRHQLSVQGGTEAVRYNISFNVNDQGSVTPTYKFNRYTIRPNLDIQATKNLKLGLSTLLSYNIRHTKISEDRILANALALPPTAVPYDEDGNLIAIPGNITTTYYNPLIDQEYDGYRYENKRYAAFINSFVEWQMLSSLQYRLNLGISLTANNIRRAADSNTMYRYGFASQAYLSDIISNSNNVENILTFNKTFNKIHALTLTGIHSFQTTHRESSSITVNDLPYLPARWYNIGTAPTITEYGSNLRETKLLSFAGRLFYGFNERYLLTLTMRADGATQFAEGNKWGYFPSAAFAWRITEEKFMTGTNTWLSNLKLRLSYGVSGNQAISPYQTQGRLTETLYAFEENEAYGMRPNELSNKDLKWESTAVYNIGLDFGLFKGRISGNIELYRSVTTDLLMYRNLPNTTGFTQVLENVGITQNKGVEFGLKTMNFKKQDFTWNTNFTFYLNREEIVELYNGKVDDAGSGWFIGQPISVFYDYEKLGIWQLDEAKEAAKYGREPGQIKIKDQNGDGIINTTYDRKILGSRQPKFVLNVNNNFRYKNWDLAFDVNIRWGFLTSNSGIANQALTNTNLMVNDYWTPTNPTNAYPRPDHRRGAFLEASTLNYYDGSYVRLKTLTLGYTLPESFVNGIPIQSARVYFTGDNLMYWTKDIFRDLNIEPEYSTVSTQIVFGDMMFPALRTYFLGLNITF